MALLFDIYGPLLTERQQAFMRAYYQEDLSLTEIAGQDGISRQAVHDLIKRSEAALLEYEEKLGFLREYWLRQQRLEELATAIRQKDEAAVQACLVELQAE